MTTNEKLSPAQFAELAASWGSYMTAGDPGACMYGFDDTGTLQSEDHRAGCIAFIENHCRGAADANIAAGEYLDGHEELDAMVKYLQSAPVAA